MKLLLFSSTALLLSCALAAPFQLQIPANLVRAESKSSVLDLQPCRIFDGGPASCVDKPLRKEADTYWCSYRLCAASFVPAQSCPADQTLQATDKCLVKQVTRDMYKCDGQSYKAETTPAGCKLGADNCKEIHTCSCTKLENHTSKSLTWQTSYTPNCSGSSEKKVNVDCAKCGQVLECYVNSGSSKLDTDVCNVILDRSQFCPTRGRTPCGQQCDGRETVKCFPGEKWGTCPAVLGSTNGAAKCKGGAKGRPAALSNFASYTISVGTEKQVSCLIDKCDTGGTCPCSKPM